MQGSTQTVISVGKGKDPRDVVTPLAFSISDSLIGMALASPFHRACALLIDLFFVFLLTHVSSVFLAGFVAVIFFRAGERLKQKKKFNALRILLRFAAAFLLFIFAVALFEQSTDYGRTNLLPFTGNESSGGYAQSSGKTGKGTTSEIDNIGVSDAITLAAETAAFYAKADEIQDAEQAGQCEETLACWQDVILNYGDALSNIRLPIEEKTNLLEGALSVLPESADPRVVTQLREQLFMTADVHRRQITSDEGITSDTVADSNGETKVDDPVESQDVNIEPEKISNYSLVEWAKGVATDLGLGVGWAAFYFTAFTVWLRGCTPGKKIMGIKVIKLDAQPLNLWESFGRYGGYGAGVATGLLGFLQIYWDPNRQAIQDKISETLVINIRKHKVNVTVAEHEQPSQPVT